MQLPALLDIAVNSHIVIEIISAQYQLEDQIVNIAEHLAILTQKFPLGIWWKLKEEQLREWSVSVHAFLFI